MRRWKFGCTARLASTSVSLLRASLLGVCLLSAGLLSACGPTVELDGLAFGVAFTSPSGGGESISPEVLPRVGFTRAVDTATSLDRIHLEEEDGTDVPATLLFVDESKVVVIAPRAFLEPGSSYTIVVPAETESADGISIGTTVNAVFETRAD